MVTDLVPGANLALPGDVVAVRLGGPFDLSAVVVGDSGQVSGDADLVFYNAPSAPGVQLRTGLLTITPARLRRGAARVVVVATPEQPGTPLGSLPAPAVVLADVAGSTFARLTAPPLRTETLLLLAEIYRRDGWWRVRAIGQGYADGLGGLARDFGVEVDDEPSPRATRPTRAPAPSRGGAGSGGRDPGRRGSGGGSRGGSGGLGTGGRSGGREFGGREPGGREFSGATGGRDLGGGPGGRESGDGSGLLAEVVTATNAERTRHGLHPLTVDPRLARAAQGHSEDMVRRAFFAHENPDGAQVWDRGVAAGYPYRKIAENIAAGQRTAAEVVDGWMNSPGHRANILDGELTQIGVGHAVGGSYGVYWTQVFGTPR